jgi:sugar phosphate isomerase/epimerase
VPWSRFFSVLTDIGYQGPVCVEVEDRAFEADLDARRRALRQSANFLRQYFGVR